MAPKKTKPEIVRPTERAAVIEAIVQSLRFLAGKCDWASTRDDQGFNQPDASTGHGLADQSSLGPLTTGQLVLGYLLLRKYDRTQLLPSGLVLPAPETVVALFGDIEAARDNFRGAIRWSATHEQILVSFPFRSATNRIMTGLVQRYGGNGRQKNDSGYGYYWLLNQRAIHTLCHACPDFEQSAEIQELHRNTPVDQAPAVRPFVTSAASPSAAGHVSDAPCPQGVIVLENGEIGIRLLDIWKDKTRAYNALDTIKAVRAQWGGTGWSGYETKTWYVHPSAASVIVELFPAFVISDEVRALAVPATHSDVMLDDTEYLALVE